MIAFLAYSGLRIEEVRRLVWGDIGKESISVPDIKHATSRRPLYINASLAEVIESLRRERRGNSPDDPVFAIELSLIHIYNAPDINVDGAKRALRDFPLIEKIYLVGREETCLLYTSRRGFFPVKITLVLTMTIL